MKSYITFLMLCNAIFPSVLYAKNCTNHPIGLSKYYDYDGNEITVSVAKTSVNSTVELAESESRIKARTLLLTDPLFKSEKNKISGVINGESCIEGDNVFSIVKTSKKSIRHANEMNKQIKNSIKNSPTPSKK